jgi:hypothetical protein
MTADARKIEAEGRKNATIIDAEVCFSLAYLSPSSPSSFVSSFSPFSQAQAQARKIEAKSRNEAAQKMSHPFARTLSLTTQQVEFARGLKAQTLAVLPSSTVGSPLVQYLAMNNNNNNNNNVQERKDNKR